MIINNQWSIILMDNHQWDSQRLLEVGSEECQQQAVPPWIVIVIALSLLLSWLSLLLFIVYCNYLVIVIIIFTIIQLSVPTASGAALNHCHNCHAYGLVITIVMIFNGDTRRVQTERSQRREGSPRTWWYRHHHHNLSSCIMYDNVYNIHHHHHLHESIREESASKDPKGSSKDGSTESPQANVVVRIIMLGGHNHRFV